jgi:protein phosphatase
MVNRDVTPNWRVGSYYAVGALLLLAAAVLSWPWGAPLLWPAVSCVIVAIGYAGAGPRIYRKKDGRLPLGTRLIMAPVLLGQGFSLRYYRRRGESWNEAAPKLLMGRRLNSAEAGDLINAGVIAVLDLTAEFSEVALLRQTTYHNIQILDLTAPTHAQLKSAVEFIRRNAEDGLVYVHCKIGYSRTAAVIGAYLMAAGYATDADDAMAQMREARSPLVIRPEVVEALHAFHTRCQ